MIQKVFVENFKAIASGTYLPLSRFSVFIGNNGTGKSSMIEALMTLKNALENGVDEAFKKWGGLEKVRNYNARFHIPPGKYPFAPVSIGFTAKVNDNIYEYLVRINLDNGYYQVESEILNCNERTVFRSFEVESGLDGNYFDQRSQKMEKFPYEVDKAELMLSYRGSPQRLLGIEEFATYIESWQFLHLNPHEMGKPVTKDRRYGPISLAEDGHNIADYLLWLRGQGEHYLTNLVGRLNFVLPYLDTIEPHLLQETMNPEVEIRLRERGHEGSPIPGWLLSSGTLRILALLASFVTPKKPTVLIIDEVENGLDPRTIGLLLEQIQEVYAEESMQVIVTTHSPYLLDLVPLESIILTEKTNAGSTFSIPANNVNLTNWRKQFTPGELYSTGQLYRKKP